MQQIIVVGRLTKDLEIKYSNKNKPYVVLSVATNYGKDKTTYYDFICYDKAAENHNNFLSKGDLILIKGIGTNKVNEYKGVKNYTYTFFANEVIYLNTKKTLKKSEETLQETINQIEQPQVDPFKEFGEEISLSNDDLPY